VYPLFLIAVLTVLTLGLAQRLGRLRDTVLVIGVSLLGGLIVLAADPRLAWVAEPPEDGSCGLEDEAPIRVERITVAEARALLGDETVTFVDARSGDDYVAAHIPGAVSLPANDAAGILEIQSVPILPDGQVITYCNGGACEQSEYLGLLLRDREVCKQVSVLEGGWAAWVAAEAPTVRGESQDGSSVEMSSPTEPCEPTEEAHG
jgi:rhodanese-related sulfurtransferase